MSKLDLTDRFVREFQSLNNEVRMLRVGAGAGADASKARIEQLSHARDELQQKLDASFAEIGKLKQDAENSKRKQDAEWEQKASARAQQTQMQIHDAELARQQAEAALTEATATIKKLNAQVATLQTNTRTAPPTAFPGEGDLRNRLAACQRKLEIANVQIDRLNEVNEGLRDELYELNLKLDSS